MIVVAGLVAGRTWGADVPAASTDPLLNLFIEKGYVTQDEAAKVKAEADQLRTNEVSNIPMASSYWKMNSGVKNFELFGDVRMRYEDRSATDPGGNVIDQQRLRYSLHFGVHANLADDFEFGFRLETASNPRSPWVTLGTSSSTSGPYQGPFGKSTDGVNVGQLYLGWQPEDWVHLEVGKLPNPLYTTPMVWDND
ncbi:MAG TPA: putative porin, partial [Candidatus Acidoferrum sp.]|nr:putative porin [Candidatus Acidoferrum sp.]